MDTCETPEAAASQFARENILLQSEIFRLTNDRNRCRSAAIVMTVAFFAVIVMLCIQGEMLDKSRRQLESATAASASAEEPPAPSSSPLP